MIDRLTSKQQNVVADLDIISHLVGIDY